MRIFVLLAIIVAVVCVCEGRHRERGDKQLRKKARDLGVPHSHHKHGKHIKSRLRGKHIDLDHFKKLDIKSLDDDSWMKFPKKSKACKTIKCPPKHFCLTTQATKTEKSHEKCVSNRNFREGRRLFKAYHRQKAMLEHAGQGKLSDAMETKLQRAEKMKDVYDLLKDYKTHPSHLKKETAKYIDVKSITDVKEADPSTLQECRPKELFELRKRLVGWFVLLHTESRQQHHHRDSHHQGRGKRPVHDPSALDNKHQFDKGYKMHHDKMEKHHAKFGKHHDIHKRTRRSTHKEIDVEIHGHCKCSKSVMWEFRKMDTSGDGHLEHDELATIESIKREPCLKPLIKSCDHSGDGKLSRGEFCCCMRDTVPPCAEKQRLTSKTEWKPSCDSEGYFEREQCHKSGYCWCVDIDGNTIADTKNFGSAHCGKYGPNGKLIKM